MSMPTLAVILHPSGLPHAEALGIPIWAQWLVVAVVVAVGVWLVLDGREPAAGRTAAAGPDRDEPAEWEPGEALVTGRFARARSAAPQPPRRPAGAHASPAKPVEARPDELATSPARDGATPIEVAPGARMPLALGRGTVVYVESGEPELACERGALTVHRASLPRVGAPLVPSVVGAGRQVRLGVGDLVVAVERARVVARDATDRPATLLLFGSDGRSGPDWLNPIRVLALLLGLGAGALALDRARAVEALASFISTPGGLNASRLGFSFAALLRVGGALAPTAPRASAAVFAIATMIGIFLATASRWEERLEWWGAEYVLTAWEQLPLWAVAAAGLALLALAGWWYRPRRGR